MTTCHRNWVLCLVLVLAFSLVACTPAAPPAPRADTTPSTPPAAPAPADPPKPVVEPTPSKLGTGPDNLAGIGDMVEVEVDDEDEGQFTIQITLLQLVSGEKAWSAVKEANRYNEAPGDGEEYIQAQFRVKVVKASGNDKYDLNNTCFLTYIDGKITWDGFVSVSGVEPDLRVELPKGGERTGWTHFLVKKGNKLPICVFEGTSGQGAWFRLRPE